MNILVTAGNSAAPIDKVRCITNVFSGRTGARIALEAAARRHEVVILTSRPEVVSLLALDHQLPLNLKTESYATFRELEQRLGGLVESRRFDAVIHCAAVSDYECAGVFAPAAGTRFDPASQQWSASQGKPRLIDRREGKVKSHEPEMWLRLTQTPKLIDSIRHRWDFQGVLVKFKLEVAVGDEHLLRVADASRRRSHSDLMVANTLEGMNDWAFLGPLDGGYRRIPRPDLAQRLLEAVESCFQARNDPRR